MGFRVRHGHGYEQFTMFTDDLSELTLLFTNFRREKALRQLGTLQLVKVVVTI